MGENGDYDVLRQLAEASQELAQLELEESNAVDALGRVDGDLLKATTREKELLAEIDAVKLKERQLESELKSYDQQITKAQHNLDHATSEATMQASQRELDLKAEAREELESQGLEMLERLEGLEEALSKARERQASLSKQADEAKKKLESLKEAHTAPRGDLEKRLESLSNGLESDTREAYIALNEQYGHSALCFARGDICPGCDMQLSGSLGLQLKKGGVWIKCSSCSRVLLS